MDYAVLSHAHYDHANGILGFMAHNAKAKWYVREATAEDCYFKKFIFRKYIGIPKGMEEQYPARIEKISGTYRLTEGVHLIPHTTKGLDAIGKRETMYRKTAQGWRPDDFDHEQSLVLETEKGLVIINSCSHGGVGTIVREVKAEFPGKTVYGFIGGMHLFNKKESEIRAVAEALKSEDVKFVCTGHCTKERAYRILKEELGERLAQLKVGLQIEF